VSVARPRLRPTLHFVEQVYRGEASFVVKDPVTHKYFRFRPVEARVLRCFDGTRTATEVVETLAEQGMRVSVRAVESFAKQLTSIGLIERSLAERSTLQMERLRAERRQRRKPRLFKGELMRMRWSIGDPNGLFDRTLPYVRWCFSRSFLIASLLLFAAYFVILAATWDELSKATAARYSFATFTPGSFMLLWVIFVVVTVVHELGHGYACKYFGGEVHELGVMVLYLQPAMYCNVNDAWSFPDLRARLWVTAAGGWIELVVAGVAAIIWAIVAPGTMLADVAVATMMVAGGMTLLANGNPLIPLDGYFALTDYLEIPNLRLRALEYFRWWIQRHVLRLELPEPDVTERERRVFLVYGALAAAYIGLVLLFMVSLLFGWARRAFGLAGLVLAISALVFMKRNALRRGSRTMALAMRGAWTRRRLAGGWRWGRRRLLLLSAVLLLVLVAPWPHTATGSFVVAPARLQLATAPTDGLIAEVLVDEGGRVAAGAPLVRLVNFGSARALASSARVYDSLTALEVRERARGRAESEVIAAKRASEANRLAALRQVAAATTVRAVAPGVVLSSRPEELLGQHVTAGRTLLSIGDADSVELRVAFASEGATRVQAGQVVRLISDADAAHSTRATIASVGESGSPGAVEARVRLPAAGVWRPGVRGEARVEVGRSTVLGTLLRAVRTRVRGDLLL
jgi:putative peptide zinc metalloprotease protein